MTLEELMDHLRAKCVEVGDCLIWKTESSADIRPRVSINGKRVLIRRALAEMKLGRKLRSSEYASCTCKEPLCMEFDHVRAVTVAKLRAETGAVGGYSTLQKRIHLSNKARAKAKITPEIVAAIKASTDTQEVEAAKHGIHRSMVSFIRRGKKWVDHSSPFAGLFTSLAANDGNRRRA